MVVSSVLALFKVCMNQNFQIGFVVNLEKKKDLKLHNLFNSHNDIKHHKHK